MVFDYLTTGNSEIVMSKHVQLLFYELLFFGEFFPNTFSELFNHHGCLNQLSADHPTLYVSGSSGVTST